ncbi:MAG: ComF family protein [Candidatus Eiseniibacteriota bacterium]|nr:MAG: ComF family protein [Candidatus Eisenbacteria bacterium]
MKLVRVTAALRDVCSAFAHCFLPQSCALCRKLIPSAESICSSCAASIRPSSSVFCPLCRYEAEGDPGETPCRVHVQVKAKTALRPEGPVLALIHGLKYSGRRELAPLLAEYVVSAGIVDRDLERCDVMCPVPLFPTRERERGFNQSTDIAERIESVSGVPLVRDLLVRVRPTGEQAKLPAEVRRRNLIGSFAVKKPRLAARKSILLVDDVITTGSTVAACLEALALAEVGEVLVVAVAG